jgi:DNA-directed RNA polymerase specialized sigma subunit
VNYIGPYQQFSNHYPPAEVVIAHGLFATALVPFLKCKISVALGAAINNPCTYSITNPLDYAGYSEQGAGSSRLSAHHFMVTHDMRQKLEGILDTFKKTAVLTPLPSKTASVDSDSLDFIKKLEDFAVGSNYPTEINKHSKSGVPTILGQALEAEHQYKTNEAALEQRKELERHLQDLMLLRDELVLHHSQHPEHKPVVGKINHALDMFRSYYPLGSFAKSAYAEKDIELYTTWKQSQAPEDLNKLMNHLNPLIASEASKWKQTGINPDVLQGKARTLAFEAIQTFDPSKSQLNTHVINHLRKLNRFSIENQNAIRVQEDTIFAYRKFLQHKADKEEKLGKTLSDQEALKGFSEAKKIKDFKPMIEHYYTAASESNSAPIRSDLGADSVGLKATFNQLKPTQQLIMQHTFGLNGSEILSNQDIAKRLNVSAPAVSKQKRVIENLVRQNILASRQILG